ncbi:hypothetical protein U9M48_010990 [Paspalum notatum var. saurae]|uniref:Uncharacterized protein n=1 Tax=Paspalum notatum var. saurae TaxID=547442 RepID=A0AAQ3WGW7_PASNO
MASIENATEATAAGQGGGVDGEDRISGLCDDLIVHILGLAGCDVVWLVRTGVISRRWRGLWTRVPVLFFDNWPALESAGDVGLYVAFVNGVLAQRAQSAAGIDCLWIPLFMDTDSLQDHQELVPPSMEAAEAWIRYAVQKQVKDFKFKLRLPSTVKDFNFKFCLPPPPSDGDYDSKVDEEEDKQEEDEDLEEQEDGDEDEDEEEEEPLMDLDELPSSTKLEALHLWLSARVRLPSAAVFTSLENLALEFVQLAPGSTGHLARIVSSACCPRLRHLRMMYVSFKRAETKELVIDAGELLELSLDSLTGLESLELRTPKLLDLEIESCDELRAFTFSAPALEKLTFYYNRSPVAIHGDGLPCVWFLRINLVTHLYHHSDINDSPIALLQRCSSSARSLLVHLDVPLEIERQVDLIKDKMPQLPNVTHLAVNLHPIVERHSFGDGVAGLLTRFSNLEYLSLQLDEVPGCIKRDGYYSSRDADVESAFICKHADNWASTEISLANLREAEFTGLTGTGCECRFLRFVIASATDLQIVTVRFSVNEYNLEGRKDGFLSRLIGDGTWTTNGEGPHQWYEWRPCP